MENKVFHEGELEVQQKVGVQDVAHKLAGMIKNTIMPAAFTFISQQSVIWLGVKDENNLHWTFPLFGLPGFLNSDDGDNFTIDLSKSNLIPEHWNRLLAKGTSIGSLIIDLSTRRRIRINGEITEVNKDHIVITVFQCFPNCPKYIRRRNMTGNQISSNFNLNLEGKNIDQNIASVISNSDTAFVTSSGQVGIDVSHRGGEQGFIKIRSDSIVIVPDFAGNNMFSTLGNFKVNPFGGLLIVDFDHGRFLQLNGSVNLMFDHKYPTLNTGGTLRYWELMISEWRLYKQTGNIKWENLDYSPFNP
jgi:predicted pyridoxine 5'-phosphate oxidase superfamily flavin-nucleotide-binding protein